MKYWGNSFNSNLTLDDPKDILDPIIEDLINEDGTDYARILLTSISKNLTIDLQGIENKFIEKDTVGIKSLVHKTKGSLTILKLEKTRTLAVQIEKASLENNWTHIEEWLPHYQSRLKSIICNVEGHLAKIA